MKYQQKHSPDFKDLVVRLHVIQSTSYRRLATLTGVPKSTICNWARTQQTGRLKAGTPKCTAAARKVIDQSLSGDPFLTSIDLVDLVRQDTGALLSSSCIRRHIKRLGFTRKKPSRVPYNPRLATLRREFADRMVSTNPSDYLSIDESSFCYDIPKTMGYAKRGCRVPLSSHTHSRHRMTLIMAVSSDGVVHHQLFRGATDSVRFANFVRSIPATALRRSLLLDNAAFHKSKVVQQACRDVGVQMTFLPPYTPFFQPIEHVFGVLKHHYQKLRVGATFSWADLEERVTKATRALPTTMFAATFRCCWGRMADTRTEAAAA